MAFCEGQPYIQTLTAKFSNFTSCRVKKSITPGQSSCSFSVTNHPGSTDNVNLTFPTIVSIHDHTGRKVFAGYAEGCSRRYERNGTEIINVTFPDFGGYFGKLHVVKTYQSESAQSASVHAYNVLVSGGGLDPGASFKAVNYAPVADLTSFFFEVSELYAEEGFNQIVESVNRRWYMDYGAWETIDQLQLQSQGSGAAICDLFLYDAVGGLGFAPFNIVLPYVEPICGDQAKYMGVEFTFTFRDVISRVLVVGKGGSLVDGNIGVKQISQTFDIAANSQSKHFKLAPFCIVVNGVEVEEA